MLATASRLGDDRLLSATYDYWLRLSAPHGVALRRDFDVTEMPRAVVPYLVLAEYLDGNGRVRYRLVGERMVERWGSNFKGETSETLYSGSYRDFIEGCFALACRSRQPVYSESTFRWDVDGYAWTRRLMLPLCPSPEAPPVQCLIVQVWPSGGRGDRLPLSEIVGRDPIVENDRMVLGARG